MGELKCKDVVFHYGRDREQVQRECDEDTCSREKACEDGDEKRRCSKRSIVGPSKEDPTLYLGLVWCPCPKDIPQKSEKSVRSKSTPIPHVHEAEREE
jgi:hypothetical protein